MTKFIERKSLYEKIAKERQSANNTSPKYVIGADIIEGTRNLLANGYIHDRPVSFKKWNK
jgi:hypothetical protein